MREEKSEKEAKSSSINVKRQECIPIMEGEKVDMETNQGKLRWKSEQLETISESDCSWAAEEESVRKPQERYKS